MILNAFLGLHFKMMDRKKKCATAWNRKFKLKGNLYGIAFWHNRSYRQLDLKTHRQLLKTVNLYAYLWCTKTEFGGTKGSRIQIRSQLLFSSPCTAFLNNQIMFQGYVSCILVDPMSGCNCDRYFRSIYRLLSKHELRTDC